MNRICPVVADACPGRSAWIGRTAPVLLAALFFTAGCRQPVEPNRPAGGVKRDEAATILVRMRDAYHTAEVYSDQGVMRLSYHEQGRPWTDEAPFAVRLKRPQRIRVRAYNTMIWCDGEQLVARIEDKLTSNLDGQVLVRECPDALSLTELYRDPVLREAITSGLGRQPVQLELLLSDSPLEAIFQPTVSKRLLASGDCDGHRCYRIEATTAEGPFVFWVDERQFLLRRLEYPVRALLPEMASVADAQLVADFVDATFEAPESDALFRPDIPADAKRVQSFVLPPQPLPTQLFGKEPPGFAFVNPAGGRLTREELRGRVTVLAWFQDHPACRRYLEQLDQVRVKRTGSDKIDFYAVCTEPSTRSHEDLKALLRTWKVSVPLLRDLEACGRDVFQIPWAPTLVILDSRGQVQVFEVGANPYLTEQLPVVLDRLIAGHNLAAEIVAAQQRSQEAYSQALAAGGAGAQANGGGQAEPAVASQPQNLRLESAWKLPLVDAGNILAADSAGEAPARIWVLRGAKTISEIDGDGRLVREYALPDGLNAEYLRTELDGQQRRYFAASAIQGASAVVLDERGEPVGSYPPDGYQHDGMADVQLVDVDGDGLLELVAAFRGPAGVHCATLRGEQKWVNHGLPDALSVAGAPRNADGSRQLVIAGPRGDLLQTDALGRDNQSHTLEGRAIFHIYTADNAAPGTVPYCGITFDETGKLVALGIDGKLTEKWHYVMPAGTYRYPVQFVTSTEGIGPGQRAWVIAGSDGTIHFVGEDGHAIDHFATGHHIRGLAVAAQGKSRLLLVSSDGQVSSWRLSASQ